ncbi:zinc finger protein 234-like isoform X2 [Toxorhynchites rutilus septentrionalis]|uniref:zinc finger protein 234-like isoform X2 n=1 Tax=Toxorhynchites rutilus septentrionalis TaxID=329112 RepID=UPI0024790C85|nr:zinc finger protein 234-like isoform X2 [Toxorhynchites rutilus septentrionalis]
MNKNCRICRLFKSSELIFMYCIDITHQEYVSDMIETVAGIKLDENDRFPDHICDQCFRKLDSTYSLWKRCQSHHLLTKCPREREDEYFRCRICTRKDVDELISLHSICDTWKLKVHEMIRFLGNVAVEEGTGLPPYVCDVCLDALDEGVGLKRLCLESAAVWRSETTFAWEKMEFESNNHEGLVVDLYAKLIDNNETGMLECSVCELGVVSNPRPDSCSGCLLQFENRNIRSCDDRTPLSETKQFFDVIEINPSGLFQKIRCKGPVCCGCDKIFLSEDDLRKHRREAHPPVNIRNEFYCEFCSSNLDCAAQLKIHQKKARNTIFMYCKKCRKIQTQPHRHQLEFHISEDVLKNFSKQIVSTYDCCVPRCNTTYDTQQMVQSHLLAAHGRNDSADDKTCGYCNASFSTESAFEEHRSHGSTHEKYFCERDNCQYTVLSLDRIILHSVQEPHKVVSKDGGKKIKPKHATPDLKHFTVIGEVDDTIDVLECESEFCCGCFEFFEINRTFLTHCEEKHANVPGEFYCGTCKREFAHEKALNAHEEKAADRIYYYCRPCEAFLWDILQVNRHKAYVHTDIEWSAADERYERVEDCTPICCGCDKQFENEEELIEHRRVKHAKNTNKFGIRCDLCQKLFGSSEQLQKHVDVAMSGVVFKCMVADCIFRCKQLSAIKFHVTTKSHRSADGPIYLGNPNPGEHRCCFMRCDFVADSYDKLINHADIEHTVSREERNLHPHPYYTVKCPVCLKGMRSEMSLMLHQQGKTTVICKCCLKRVKREEYTSHLDECSTKSTAMCEKCSEELPSQALLRKHMRQKHRVQSAKDPTVCSICSRHFSSPTVLREHMASHKNQRLWKCGLCPLRFNSYTPFINHSRVHTNEKKYGCRHGCEKRFKYQGDRDRHEKLTHLGIRPFSCGVCPASFVRDRDLRLHMRKHTGIKLFPCENCDASFDKLSEIRQHKEECEGIN